MKALVFAAGLGTRLRPYTEKHPKALVDVCGKPILRRVIDRLTDVGADNITVNVHHFADQIKDYLANEGTSIPATLHISDESDKLLDTGGGILHARQWLDGPQNEPFIVHNADILSTIDLKAMLSQHTNSGADVTLMTADRKTSRRLIFNSHGRMLGWTNLNTGEVKTVYENDIINDTNHTIALAFGGIHILSPKVFPLLEEFARDDDRFSIIPFYIANARRLDIRAYCPTKSSYSWYDIGKPETLEQARLWLSGHNIHFL